MCPHVDDGDTSGFSVLWVALSLNSANKIKNTHIIEGGRGPRHFVKHLGFLFVAHTLQSPWQKLNGGK